VEARLGVTSVPKESRNRPKPAITCVLKSPVYCACLLYETNLINDHFKLMLKLSANVFWFVTLQKLQLLIFTWTKNAGCKLHI